MNFRKWIYTVGLLMLLVTIFPWTGYGAQPSTQVGNSELSMEKVKLQKEIEEMLVCQDSCGMVLYGCDNSTAEYMRNIIKEQLAQGRDKQAILNHFVSVYGEQVLSAPPKKGFNLTAWVTPFVFMLVGIILIYLMVDKWVFVNKMESEDRKEQQDALSETKLELYQDKLADELRKRW